MASIVSSIFDSTVSWPKRAVVTAGMPYGNKSLHFGHVCGVFVPADAFARFLRDRIGADNVYFVSGTDCFGSPIEEGYRKAKQAGDFSGTIEEYVRYNHEQQKATLDAYGISLSLYEGSGIGDSGVVHQQASYEFLNTLYEMGWLDLCSTLQFYDTKEQMFLNGRQVQGYCPIPNCKSTKAYADECELGHQFPPEDLIKPISSVSGTVPEMRHTDNWYFDLPAHIEYLRTYNKQVASDTTMRSVVAKTVEEFLGAPVAYIKNDFYELYTTIASSLPKHCYHAATGNKQSFSLEFENVRERDAARETLQQAGIRYRMGKTLVPFRITGNVNWGVKAPVINNVANLSLWCWPESLWAPISFTQAAAAKQGEPRGAWKNYWCSDDAQVYQFIGEDNLYFYGIAQPALFHAIQTKAPQEKELDTVQTIDGNQVGDDFAQNSWPLRQTKLIANHHVLFGKTKASSSGECKPPSADELLNYYTAEQLRAHWLALGLDQRSVGFSPKPFDPDVEKRTDPRIADPVLKEAALLNNVFNRLARSCFYETHKNFDDYMPLQDPPSYVVEEAHKTLREYDKLMYGVCLHEIMTLCDTYIRNANKRWASGITGAEQGDSREKRTEVLVTAFYELRIATLLMHPIVPEGTELICSRLGFNPQMFFNWKGSFLGVAELCTQEECAAGKRALEPLPPRFDFFPKHESQFSKKN